MAPGVRGEGYKGTKKPPVYQDEKRARLLRVNALISSFAYLFLKNKGATVMDIYEIIAAKRPDILALADRFAVKT
jgi:hypothetical protein